MKPGLGRAMAAGFLATVVMTILMYAAPMMGMPKMDVAAMLSSIVGGTWITGMILHFINGSVIFAALYGYFMYHWLPGSFWMRGGLWGLILWFLSQVVVMPIAGNGLFASQTAQPWMSTIGSLFGHVVYGAILGAVAGTQGRHESLAQAGRQRTVVN